MENWFLWTNHHFWMSMELLKWKMFLVKIAFLVIEQLLPLPTIQSKKLAITPRKHIITRTSFVPPSFDEFCIPRWTIVLLRVQSSRSIIIKLWRAPLCFQIVVIRELLMASLFWESSYEVFAPCTGHCRRRHARPQKVLLERTPSTKMNGDGVLWKPPSDLV